MSELQKIENIFQFGPSCLHKYRISVHCFKIILLFHSLDKRYFSDPRFFLCDSESTRKKKYFKFNAIHEIFQFAFGGLSALPVEASKDGT